MNEHPDLQAGLYRCFTLDHNEDAAAARFVELFGQQPQYIVECKGLLWCGPIPQKQEAPA